MEIKVDSSDTELMEEDESGFQMKADEFNFEDFATNT